MSILFFMTGATLLESLIDAVDWLIERRYKRTHNKRKRF